MFEYQRIHKAILQRYRIAQAYSKNPKLGLPSLTSNYRCHVNYKNKERKSINHMRIALGCNFSLKENYDKFDDAIRCDKFRGLLVEKPDFQIGWNGGNKKPLEP
jgi:hypothetical protein